VVFDTSSDHPSSKVDGWNYLMDTFAASTAAGVLARGKPEGGLFFTSIA
jgi:hypothetical protein